MPNYRRPKVDGATIFFTVALADRRSDALIRNIDALREAVQLTKSERPFRIEAWVVLPDHLHCIWRLPEGDCDYSTRWRVIKSRFSRNLSKRGLRKSNVDRFERGVWQRRFWDHHIRSQEDFDGHLRYCWFNPVKHGFVERPEDWVFSSVHRDVRFDGSIGA